MRNFFRKASASIWALALIFTSVLLFPTSADVHAAVYAVWPAEPAFHNITTFFEPARNNSDSSSYHNAIDIEANGGTNVYAVYSGEVVSSDWKDAYGNMVIIYHKELGIYTFYAHASQLVAAVGANVKQGDIIAKVGSTGNSSGNHIHFGICDKLLGGFPTRTYFDPLTYFVFSDNVGNNSNISAAKCSCTEDYAGTYTTKNVVTYLNIRADHNTSAAIVGKINANEEFSVTKADGKWAHIEHNGVIGFVSMEYIQRKAELASKMTITDFTAPEGTIKSGSSFSLKGKISSALPIKKVYGGVYFRNGETTSQVTEASPNSTEYELSAFFDRSIVFSALKDGDYTYKLTAEDSKGEVFCLVTSEFTIGETEPSQILGDVNGDGSINVGDVVLLQNFLLKKSDDFNEMQYHDSDLNGDGVVNVFDLIELKREIIDLTS